MDKKVYKELPQLGYACTRLSWKIKTKSERGLQILPGGACCIDPLKN